MQKSDAAKAVAGAYYIVQLLPLDLDQAEAILALVEQALAQRRSQFDGWTGPASYVFSHLRKKKPETAADGALQSVGTHESGAGGRGAGTAAGKTTNFVSPCLKHFVRDLARTPASPHGRTA
jgi:hypothetical protein